MAKQVEGISEKGGGNDDRNDLFPIWWKRRTFFSNRRTGGKRVYRDIYRSSGKNFMR